MSQTETRSVRLVASPWANQSVVFQVDGSSTGQRDVDARVSISPDTETLDSRRQTERPRIGESSSMSEPADERLEMTLRLIKAELEAGRSRMEAIDSQIETRLAKMPARWEFYALAAAILGIALGVLQFGGDRFDGGMQAASAISAQSIETQKLTNENASQIKSLLDRADKNDAQLDAIFNRLIDSKSGGEEK
tara:strand:- start:121 stop:699 length:579 start_codon:yes stop_codon:yes gene_type:complete